MFVFTDSLWSVSYTHLMCISDRWMADPGCGYTVQTDVQLWMRDKLVEAIDIVPFGYADTLQGQAEAEENEAYE